MHYELNVSNVTSNVSIFFYLFLINIFSNIDLELIFKLFLITPIQQRNIFSLFCQRTRNDEFFSKLFISKKLN